MTASRSPTLTVPNGIALLRLIGAPGLLLLAHAERPGLVLLAFLGLEASDWLDGKLAAVLDQRSTLGARLDSVADAVMYSSLLGALWILKGELFLAEWAWMAPAVLGYLVSWAVSLAKFGKIPGYHAWSAKISWLFALLAAVALLAANDVRLLRVAAVSVTLANLEAILLTLQLDSPRSDVRSIFKLEAGRTE